MELNQAQLLVYDDKALEKFKATHNIPANVTTEHLGPNNIPHVVEEKPDHKTFSASDLFHIYTVVGPKKEQDNPFYSEFNDKFKIHSDACKEAIRAANNRQEFKDAFSPEMSERKEGYATSSSSRDSLDLVGGEEVEEVVGQLVLNRRAAPTATPPPEAILLATHALPPTASPLVEVAVVVIGAGPGSSGAYVLRKREGKEPLVDSPKRPRRETSLVGAAELWKPDFSTCELGMQVTEADSAQYLDTSLALARAIMLPSDFAAFVEEPWNTMRNLLSLQRAMATSDRMADYAAVVQAQGKAAAVEAALTELQLTACGPVYERVFTRGINWAGDSYSRQVAEVRFESFLEGCLSYLKELGVPEDNPAWARAAPAPEFLEFLAPYSPLILPGFNEEEFLNKPEEDEVIPEPVLDLIVALNLQATNPAEEVRRAVVEESGERFVEETRANDGGDADQNSPFEF
ncbi:hypothetical protein Acr_06g0008110 [Actinidia rufa]|uniref:Uncharacterized protein n=1 Tax=Actinidia rufa TaxID=165716 RepID=A0A7J0EQV9_9ERIC|nr:hypothetical protein Acr_06g0008110 [Actinidia rufa]